MGVCSNQRVLGQSTTKRSYVKTPENRDWVTIFEACSIDGHIINPLVLFKGKELQSTWFPPETPSNWHFRCTENAFTTNKVSMDWLVHVFLPQTDANGAVRLLLCDNHGSHTTVPFMYECYRHNVQLVYMPSHSSHILQPLDVGVFSILKRKYRKEITNLSRYEETQPVQRSQFIKYYIKARAEALQPFYIQSGWRGTGLSPYNPQKVLNSSQVIQKLQTPVSTPQTPHTKKRKSSVDISTSTPISGRHFQVQIESVLGDISLQRDARILIRKTAKVIDQFTWKSTEQSLQLTRLSTALKDKTTKKRTRVDIDSNKVFATINEIKKAQDRVIQRQEEWDRIDRVKQAQLTSEALRKSEFTSLCIEWHVNDAVGAVN